MADLTGQTIGKYRLVEKLGAGGMAEVYKAYQPQLERHVAIKFIRPELAVDEDFQARFEQEAKAIARLSHGNIVHVYDFGQEQQRYYLVMEFVRGCTLKQHLQSLHAAGKTIPLDEALSITRQVGEALDYAHQQGIIHRDVKPDNILVTPEGRAVLNDFGIAKIVESADGLTSAGATVGTPAYMSPEQVKGDKSKIGPASDLYSLGIILYEMATGQTPFTADTPMALMLKHISDTVPIPHTLNPGLPQSVEQIMLKALAKDPKNRYATVGAMAQALQAVRLDDTVLSNKPPSSRAARWPAWIWAVAVIVILAGLLGVAVVAVGGFALVSGGLANRTLAPETTVTTPVLPTYTLPSSPPPALSVAENTPTLTPVDPTAGSSPTPAPALPTATNTSAPTVTATPSPPASIPSRNINVTQLALYENAANHLAWLPDGKLLVIAGHNLHLYDVSTLQDVQTIPVDGGEVAFSPDGTLLAVASYDGVRLLDTTGWGELRVLAGSKGTKSVAFSPNGTMLATGTGETVKLWDVSSGDELLTLLAGPVRSVAFSPDGRILAAGAAGVAGQEIKLWDAENGNELNTLTGHSNWINSVVFSPDGQLLASGSVDKTIRLWDVTSGRQVRVLNRHTNQIESVAFSPDGQLLASASWDLTVKLWDVAGGNELRSLTGHTGRVQSVAFSPDGDMLASGSGDQMRLWSLQK